MFTRIALFATFAFILPAAAIAQTAEGTVHISRDSLVELLKRSEQTASSRAYSDALRDRARKEAELLKSRLQAGDFQVGDRIILQVERQTELTDTFTVRPGPSITLPQLGEFSLAGLLRAELEGKLAEHLKKFIVDPKVQAVPLMRIWIEGGVTTPGVYLVPAQSLITDALMQAGGTTREARVTAIRIERDNRRIWEGEALQRAVTEGRTLDQLSLKAGDHIVVEEIRGGSNFDNIRNAVIGLIPLIAILIQLVN
jgi:protein involved in polysaccharide export with SLBB domain